MDDFKFPILREPHPPPPKLTMDEYLRFVMSLHLHPAPRREPVKERPMPPDVRFRLDSLD